MHQSLGNIRTTLLRPMFG